MSDLVFGLDFGTTNSLAALVVGDEVVALTNEGDDKPHPSVVWYRGDEVIVGRKAREHIESLEGGAALGFVRSPKVTLRRDGPVHVEGRAVDPSDVVSEVLRHIREKARSRDDQSYQLSRAVMTIPVDFAGPQRRALRVAAGKAGINVLQFVHEPAAALYSYLRDKPDYNRDLSQLENRVVLVFDWGGGTLDLTACRIVGGVVMQVANRGNSEIGGDCFDDRIRNEIRTRHAAQHDISDISALEQPGVMASLLAQCELAKIELSTKNAFPVFVKDYLRGDGAERNLAIDLNREDLEKLSGDLVRRGLAEIDRLLEESRLDRNDIELCLATGGMVNMPAIWNGLVERFGARVPALFNRDRIIAEGAAWIAHDNLRLTLAKPIEVLVADGGGRGAYLPIVDAGLTLPVENEDVAADSRRFFCVDPRDGVAVFEFTKPRKVGLLQSTDERSTMRSLNLQIDPSARPFLERLECKVRIDHDFIAHVSLHSKGRGESLQAELHELEFGLSLPKGDGGAAKREEGNATGEQEGRDKTQNGPKKARGSVASANIELKSNVSDIKKWQLVPGDVVKLWKRNFLVTTSKEATAIQREEAMYYTKCSRCYRTAYEISTHGPIDACQYYQCSEITGVGASARR